MKSQVSVASAVDEVSPDAIEEAAPALSMAMARVIERVFRGDLLAYGVSDTEIVIGVGQTATGGHFGYLLLVDGAAHRILTEEFGPTALGLLGVYGKALEDGLDVEVLLPGMLRARTGDARAWSYEWLNRGPTAWLVGACVFGPKLTGVVAPPDRRRTARAGLPLLIEDLIRKSVQSQR